MANIVITTDGTITGTVLSVDGKDVTKDEKVVSLEFYSRAPYKSKYSGDTINGMAAVSFEVVSDDGKIERKMYGTTDTAFSSGIGQTIKSSDSVIRYIGSAVDNEISDLVDKIVNHCKDTNIKCPDKEILLSRSYESLKDKAEDLGIKVDITDSTDNSSDE